MHVAIIMDGNRRWARARGHSVCQGYLAGESALDRTVAAALSLNVRTLTVFGFSNENWKRDAAEVSALMQLCAAFASRRREQLVHAGVRVRVCGDLSRMPFPTRASLRALERATAANSRLTLVLALNYGGREEILHAVRSIAERGDLRGGRITEDEFRKHLYLPDLSDPDLLIRTGGEQRLSNFLLFQLAYSELLTLPIMWPDFTGEHLADAVAQAGLRERRFGA